MDNLERIEADYTCNAIVELIDNPEKGNFDLDHLCRIHKRIFQDIYEWAGEIRKDLNSVLKDMVNDDWNSSREHNVDLFCLYLTEVWKIHICGK